MGSLRVVSAFYIKLKAFSRIFTAVLLTLGLLILRGSAAEAYGLQPTNYRKNESTNNQIEQKRRIVYFQTLPLAVVSESQPDCNIDTCIALTFDDGPNLVTTPQILNILDKYNTPATFFVVGNRVAQNSSLLVRMQLSGDEVENHSWSHPDFTKLNNAQIKDEINKTQAAVIAAGLPAPKYFRPPYEAINANVLKSVNMPFILWNIDPQDWKLKDPGSLVQTIASQVKPGSIIILHDIKQNTISALPKVIEILKTKYKLVTVKQLLNLPEGSSGEFSKKP